MTTNVFQCSFFSRLRPSTAILRHSNVSLTINVYIKSVTESQVNAMEVLEAKFGETSNNLPTNSQQLLN